jgi:hypothetical protein
MNQLILMAILALSINAYAQDDKTVTLVVNGQGKTQDEAKQNALRSAIEQAFGTFISSKTEVLNDNLVKDEIVSVANGNIQKYDVISEVQIPDGDYATSLKATVSITRLTSFVESKGVVVEFKGSILAANVKQQMLNEKNEEKSITNVVSTCKEILDRSCDFVIVRGEPIQKNDDNNKWAVPISINVTFNQNIDNFNQYFLNSIKGLCMTQEEVSQYQQLGKKTYKITIQNDYYFRSKSTILAIIDLIYYTRHSVMNFEITNGIDRISSSRDDIEIIEDNLKPFASRRCPELFEKYNRYGMPICGKQSERGTNYFRRYMPQRPDDPYAGFSYDNWSISLAELETVQEYIISIISKN